MRCYDEKKLKTTTRLCRINHIVNGKFVENGQILRSAVSEYFPLK